MSNDTINKGIILLLLQSVCDRLHPISADSITSTLTLAMENNLKVKAALLTDELSATMKNQLEQSGLHEVFVFCNENFTSFDAELHCKILTECIERVSADVVLAPATPEGRALAPMIAAILKTGVTADCTALSFNKDGLLLQTRPAFGGNVMAEIITPTARPQIATLRFGKPKSSIIDYKTTISCIDIPAPDLLTKGRFHIKWVDKIDLEGTTQPKRIIALGRGLVSKDDIRIFEDIARKADAVLMCSRALVERKWFSRKQQIGLSGLSVSPELLITFGISGSVQFLAGAHTAKRICAVNTDAHAPIMQEADIPIVGDMYDIAEEMLSMDC